MAKLIRKPAPVNAEVTSPIRFACCSKNAAQAQGSRRRAPKTKTAKNEVQQSVPGQSQLRALVFPAEARGWIGNKHAGTNQARAVRGQKDGRPGSASTSVQDLAEAINCTGDNDGDR